MASLTEYGHLAADGLWTGAFRAAMNALVSQGGGTLTVPQGRYLSAPIRLYSGITLHLEQGAQIVFTDDEALFPLVDMEFEGIPGKAYMPCLYALDAQNVGITGAGTLDGSGGKWWEALKSGALKHPRPFLVCFQNCANVRMDGVTLQNSPCWTVHPLYCDDVAITNLRIYNPADSPNTDGINPNSSSNVRIADCLIDVGDDCIAIKAGTEDTPKKRACEHIVVERCRMLHGHGGVVIGSEMSGGVRDVRVENCVFIGTDRGIRLKTRRGRGGAAQRLSFRNIEMRDVLCPFVFNMYYFCGKGGKLPFVRDKAPHPVGGGTPQLSDISMEQVTVRGATACAGFLYGLPESPVRRVRIADCTVEMIPGSPGKPAMMDDLDDMEAAGLYLRNGEDIDIRGLRVEGQRGTVLDADSSVWLSNGEDRQ
ncbi:MAG TPA: glycoside hydrolase family 28 protein [Candidatus Limiplasma sp.]|nr:glycoside hydrolase family 28 protein [Candidatus Limiplasma sp.]HRX07758.1 glycoside hydrolase family 28 protein [Candidatus Limiplasma sp.]